MNPFLIFLGSLVALLVVTGLAVQIATWRDKRREEEWRRGYGRDCS